MPCTQVRVITTETKGKLAQKKNAWVENRRGEGKKGKETEHSPHHFADQEAGSALRWA